MGDKLTPTIRLGDNPVVVFYRSATTRGSPDAAPAQLDGMDVSRSLPDAFHQRSTTVKFLINYDVSYVNKLTAPVAMEAAGVPITLGDQISLTQPPTYYGSQDYGWNPTTTDATTFATNIANFVENGAGGNDENPRQLFWRPRLARYYNPNQNDIVIPSGANVYQESPITGALSPYDSNKYLVSSNTNNGPIADHARRGAA